MHYTCIAIAIASLMNRIDLNIGVDPAWIAECYNYHLASRLPPDDDDHEHVTTEGDKQLTDDDLGHVIITHADI